MSRFREIVPGKELLDAAARGEREARATLYRQAAPAVHALARRMLGSRSAADDILQDSMLAMFEHLDGFRGECPFGLWLRRIVITRCLMVLRSPWQRARLAFATVDENHIVQDGAGVAELIDLERALGKLAPLARAVLWMHEVEGLSHEEIAAAFGRSVSFSKSRLARALRELGEAQEAPCVSIRD